MLFCNKGKNKKVFLGFTLIELMVVVAIIGLLVAFSLVALKHYRVKGEDAAIKTELLSVRNAAELYYSEHPNGFKKVCYDGDIGIDLEPNGDPAPNDNSLNDDKFGAIEESIKKKAGSYPTCHDDFSSYAVISSLKAADCWCIDSTGDSKEVNLGPGETCELKLTGNSCP